MQCPHSNVSPPRPGIRPLHCSSGQGANPQPAGPGALAGPGCWDCTGTQSPGCLRWRWFHPRPRARGQMAGTSDFEGTPGRASTGQEQSASLQASYACTAAQHSLVAHMRLRSRFHDCAYTSQPPSPPTPTPPGQSGCKYQSQRTCSHTPSVGLTGQRALP